MTAPIIIIGSGLAGWTTVRELRKLDPNTPVTLITLDGADFYAKPSLSNALQQGRTPAQLVSTDAQKMAQTHQVTLLAHTRVLSIDPASQSIKTSQGGFNYSQLVLATGAQSIRVPLQGNAADNVLSVNSLDDYARFHAQLAVRQGAGKHVLIMGAGLIGCEFANDLVAAGHQVTVVDPAAGPIAALLPPPVGAQLRDALGALGVSWHFGATVQSVDPTDLRYRAELSDGHTIAADIVLSAIGLRPDTSLAKAAGLACERGIVVDAHLQTSAQHIYALGDGAQYGGRGMPYVMPIMHAAKALGATLAGTPTEVIFPVMPVAIKTPALPIVLVAPPPGTPGHWQSTEADLWEYLDVQSQPRGFALVGKQVARRTELSKRITH
jgi:rubredoxin-NAD+ reductase